MCERWESGRVRHGKHGSKHSHRHPSWSLWPAGPPPLVPRCSPVTFIQDLGDPAQHNAGPLGPWGCGRRSVSRAAELRARRQRRCIALRPARRLPMGTVRAPGPAASGAGPRKPVGNRTTIGAADNRSASGQPIGGGEYRSGAFRVGLETDNRRTLDT